MLGSIFGGQIESSVSEKIQNTLDDLAVELNEPDYRNIWITIKAINEDRDFVCQVFHRQPSGISFVRDVTIKEIVAK